MGGWKFTFLVGDLAMWLMITRLKNGRGGGGGVGGEWWCVGKEVLKNIKDVAYLDSFEM